MDILQSEIDECFKSSAALVMFNILAEKARASVVTEDSLKNLGTEESDL
jgi:hypothetical protein